MDPVSSRYGRKPNGGFLGPIAVRVLIMQRFGGLLQGISFSRFLVIAYSRPVHGFGCHFFIPVFSGNIQKPLTSRFKVAAAERGFGEPNAQPCEEILRGKKSFESISLSAVRFDDY